MPLAGKDKREPGRGAKYPDLLSIGVPIGKKPAGERALGVPIDPGGLLTK